MLKKLFYYLLFCVSVSVASDSKEVMDELACALKDIATTPVKPVKEKQPQFQPPSQSPKTLKVPKGVKVTQWMDAYGIIHTDYSSQYITPEIEEFFNALNSGLFVEPQTFQPPFQPPFQPSFQPPFQQPQNPPKEKQQPQPQQDRVAILEKKIHDLINVERNKNGGLSKLAWNDLLGKAARGHSEDMATRNYFSHNSPEGHDFVWRYNKVGFSGKVSIGGGSYLLGAENIAYRSSGGQSLDLVAQGIVDQWMTSSGHRKNILTPVWLQEGIGVAFKGQGYQELAYATQNFC
ncbi:TPA: hypothetical protein DDZ86_04540 [Candidatus Dependentiae bacterium]|nr:MAG: hypothetical protein UW09_C0002G0139 [candidate division TM6 bacterium GW2011_GWF2_43_87]HBL98881.1 hypothetical protein [Candidatus Dependentiae bacterium]